MKWDINPKHTTPWWNRIKNALITRPRQRRHDRAVDRVLEREFNQLNWR